MYSMKPRIIIIMVTALMLVFTSCSENERLADDIYFSNVDAQNIKLGGAPLLIPAYGEIYATGYTTIECADAGTYYLFSGNTTTGELLGFADNGHGRLTYTDITTNRICLITTSMTMSVPIDDVPAIITCKLYINGQPDEASLVGDYISIGDVADSFPIVCLVEILNKNDYMELYVASNAANTTVVVNTMTLVATTVD